MRNWNELQGTNDRRILNGAYYFPVFKSYPETVFGGDFHTETDYLDPYIRQQFEKPGNWAIYPPNPYGAQTINYFSDAPAPAAPSHENWLGTDAHPIAGRQLTDAR